MYNKDIKDKRAECTYLGDTLNHHHPGMACDINRKKATQ